MTDDQLYQWKLNVRVTFLELLCQQFLRTAALAQPDPEKWLQEWATKAEAEIAKLRFSTNEPVQSDMLASESQECVRAFISSLLSKS